MLYTHSEIKEKYKSTYQIRKQNKLYELGINTIEYDGIIIKIYDKERLLIVLARNKNQIVYDLYKEIVTSCREIVDLINMKK